MIVYTCYSNSIRSGAHIHYLNVQYRCVAGPPLQNSMNTILWNDASRQSAASEMNACRRKRVMSAYLVYKKSFLKQEKQYWIHPFTDSRLTKGRFHTSFADLWENPAKFTNYFWMSVQTFDEFAGRISGMIKSQDTWMGLSISPLEMLDVTLR